MGAAVRSSNPVPRPPVATEPAVDGLLGAGAAVAIGVSGGKDSQAAALATIDHLDQIGHTGPRVLIHSDLGMVEWNSSLPVCRRLAEHLGLELIVVRRAAGDLMDRWESRRDSSVRRYANLETVTVVPCWSTPSLRFCTSELKTHIITAELKRRFRIPIINVTGVRRAESKARSKGSIASPNGDGRIWNWRPLSDWSTEEVFTYIAACGLEVHPAYTALGMSRVSCRFCIMSSLADLQAAAAADESHALFRRMVELEITSTFAFQGSRWLADVAPGLLDAPTRARLVLAKAAAKERVALESVVPDHLLYTKGWPTRMPSTEEARLLAHVRTRVSGLLGIHALYLDAASVRDRYADLMLENFERAAA